MATFTPRRDVVGFHLFYLEMPATNWANTFLPLIHLTLHIAIEGSYIKMMLIAIHNIPIDTTFVLHIAVFHQLAYPSSQVAFLIGIVTVKIVHLTPLYTFHLLAFFSEVHPHPTDNILVILPQLIAILIITMLYHVFLDIAV